MAQWLTVDRNTASGLRSRLPGQTVVDLPEQPALKHLLNHGTTVVAVLPCRGMCQATLAVFRWNQAAVAPEPRDTRPGGFLGLSDQAVFEEEPGKKKGWWRRFWED